MNVMRRNNDAMKNNAGFRNIDVTKITFNQ